MFNFVNFGVFTKHPFFISITLDGIEKLSIDESENAKLSIVFNLESMLVSNF